MDTARPYKSRGERSRNPRERRAVRAGTAGVRMREPKQPMPGSNVTRAAPVEFPCAERLHSSMRGAERVKFARDGSTIRTAAIQLAGAHTAQTELWFGKQDFLTCLGNGITNRVLVSALPGRRESADLGRLSTPKEHACLLSTAHGTVIHELAGAFVTMDCYESHDVVPASCDRGRSLR